MSFGFALRKLTLTGPGVANAELGFAPGLNVITGPSDTGKTFIAQCIGFVMGSGTPPKEIPEASQYTAIMLEMEDKAGGQVYLLERSLRGGDIRLSSTGIADRVLGWKHQPGNRDTVSSFLLGLSGLDGKMVRTNQLGETRELSFRDIAPLILIDEEKVIKTTSPVLTGHRERKTAEGCVFRLLLTGIDDSSVIARENPKIVKGRREGKAEVLEALLQQTRDRLHGLGITGNISEEKEQLARLEAALETTTTELAVEQGSVASLENLRRSAWTRLREIESRADVLVELQKRFLLLREQYSSDLRRLDAIAETAFRLGQLNEERCPVCGAPAEHHDVTHQQAHATPADVAQACKAEAEKITILLRDLQRTLKSNAAEVEALTTEKNTRRAELEAASTELKTMLEPRLQVAVQNFRESQTRRNTCLRGLELLERQQELEGLLAEATAPRRRERADSHSSTVSSGEAEQFSQDVEAQLRAWRFPNLDRVVFSEDDQDVVISGRPRGSFGKGVRAITHAAFNLALLRFCARNGMPFPGLILIDSPLVVFREPDPEEGAFPLHVKDTFYRSIAAGFGDAQVVVLENDDPPADLNTLATCVHFTGNDFGRRGFIPTN